MSINTPVVSTVIPFQFKNQEIRTVQKDNTHWFVASDICEVLGLGNVTNAIRPIPKNHLTLNQIKGADKRLRRVNLISEAGMYRLVLRSDKPEAEPFIEWVTSEVLPTIRKTGAYSQPDFDYEFSRKRFIVSFRNDNKAFLQEIPEDQFLISRKELPRWLADPGNHMPKEEQEAFLKEIALAAMARLTLHPAEAWGILYGKETGLFSKELAR